MLRVPFESLAEGDVVLEDAQARYVTRVHRLRAGDRFVAFEPTTATEADVEVLAAARSVSCRVGVPRPARALARTGITLVQALGKGDKPDQVIRDATALGVERIVLCESARAVVRPADRAESKLRRWQTIAVEAARQSGRGDVPRIDGPLAFGVALTASPAARRLCFDPGASTSLAVALEGRETGEPLALLVGPEGGFDSSELAQAVTAGYVPVALFDFVLRTETAAVAALGAVLALAGASSGLPPE